MGRTSEAEERKKHIDTLMLFPEDAPERWSFFLCQREKQLDLFTFIDNQLSLPESWLLLCSFLCCVTLWGRV